MLRTGFIWQDAQAQALQAVHRDVALPFAEYDWQARPDQQAALDELSESTRAQGFVLEQAPLLSLKLVRTGHDRFHLIYTNHHILLDGWSRAQLFGEVLQHYAGQPLPAIHGHYRDYIGWLQAQDASLSEAFWKGQLATLHTPTQLARGVSTAPAAPKGSQLLHLGAAHSTQLKAFAQSHKVTLNTLVQAAWLLLLQRYTGQATVAFGATVAGRPAELAGIEQQLGLFINSLPVVVSLCAEQPLADYLQALQVQNLQLREHEHTPLSSIQRAFAQDAFAQRGEALFDSLLVFENYPVAEALRQAPGGLSFSGMQAQENTNYPLTLMVAQGERLRLNFDYRCSHFQADTVQSIGDQLLHLLWQFCADGRQPLGEIGLLDSSGLRQST